MEQKKKIELLTPRESLMLEQQNDLLAISKQLLTAKI